MPRFLGQVPGDYVNYMGPKLSSNLNTGATMAEELFRDEHTRGVMLKIVAGKKLSAEELAGLPALVNDDWASIIESFKQGGSDGN